MTESTSAHRKGAVAGLLAAALFGVSAPLGKRLVAGLDAQLLAGLLYAGAAFGFWVVWALRPAPPGEAPLRRADAPTLAAIALLGGILGPVLLLLGLARVSSVVGSSLLNLEAPATILVAAAFFGEHVGKRVALAAAFIVVGAAVIGFAPGAIQVDAWGVGFIALACLAWGVDNNLTQRLSSKDPFAIVRLKATIAALTNVALGVARGAAWPGAPRLAGVLVLGLCSYGLSVLLDAYALRRVGAAREAAYFATAPFVGAIVSVAFFDEPVGRFDLLGLASMIVGVVILVRERHGHPHVHEPLTHEHAHVHDEHHQHEHVAGDPPGEPHAHVHDHALLAHDHPHLPDLHHRHTH